MSKRKNDGKRKQDVRRKPAKRPEAEDTPIRYYHGDPDPIVTPEDDARELRESLRQLDKLPRSPRAPDKRKRGESWRSSKIVHSSPNELEQEVAELRDVMDRLNSMPSSIHRPDQSSRGEAWRPGTSKVPSNAELYQLIRRLERRLAALEQRVAKNIYDPERQAEILFWFLLIGIPSAIFVLLLAETVL